MSFQVVGCIILFVLVVDILLRFYFGRKALELLEKSPPFHVEAIRPQKQATPFQVETSDGLTLRGGIYHPEDDSPRGLIVFCAETIGTHWSAVKYCQALIDAGFIVVSFDFRNQGESDFLPGYDSRHWVTEYEVGDLVAVLNWIQEQDSLSGLPVGIMGVSRGAAVALLALSRRPEIQFVCSDSGYTNDLLISHYLERWAPMVLPKFVMLYSRKCLWHLKWTLYAGVWLRSFKRKCRYVMSTNPFEKLHDKHVLLISGSRDSYVPPAIARRLQAMLGADQAELWIVQKAAHNGARSVAESEYDVRITEFFRRMLPQPVPVQHPAVEVVPRQGATLRTD